MTPRAPRVADDVHGSWHRAASGAGLLDADGHPQPTIFAEMSALASRTGAINLGQGFPDEDGPPEVLEAAHAAIDAGYNQYPPGTGLPVLREAIATHQRHWYGIEADPAAEVLVTAGATEAIAAAILAFTEPGDEVVVAEPYYDSYGAIAALAGARLVTVPVSAPGFLPEPEALDAAVSDRTRVILVNTPHNPSGAVWPRELLEHVVALAHRHDAIIVTDEVYEHLVFEGAHVPVAALPGGWERTLTISSGGKTFSVTGWKVGWAVGPARLVTALTAVKQFLTYVNAGPFQPAIAVGLGLPDAVFHGAATALRDKRDLLVAGLADAGLTVYRPSAGYFVVVDTSAIGEPDATAFARSLPERAGIVGVPVSALVSEAHRAEYASLLRFAFCKRVPVLQEAVARLGALGR
ncbi:MAG: aminotransferase [Micrococcales bacterium 73-13]|nr:MAG: aminotransferase [Micrococcales bacterium 73-13]